MRTKTTGPLRPLRFPPFAFVAPCLSLLLLAACGSQGASGGAGGIAEGGAGNNYAGIGPEERLQFTGTEPFWGGSVTGTRLTYTTPENPDGTTIEVQRFAGNNGIAYTGKLGGQSFDMAVSEAPCSDGMSSRAYPFTVTLRIAGEVRNGCGWTQARGFTEPERP